VHRNNILVYIQQDAALHSLFYLETALHVSGGTITHHHHHHHLSVKELGHLLTRSGLMYPEASLKVCHGSFCQLGNSTHHQERKQLYLQHLVFVTPLLLSAAVV
jgi:hypothetical protein